MLKSNGENFELLLAILDSAGEGIVVLDERGALLYFNEMAEQILRLDLDHADPAIWRGMKGLYYPDRVSVLPPEANPLLRALAGESSSNVEMFVRHSKLPEGAFVRATGRPIIDKRGASRGAMVTFRDVSDLRVARETAQQLAIVDPLTNVANRRALNERLGQLLAEANRGRQFSLALMDLDHFKLVNDRHGHQAGDEVLVAVASALRKAVRETDFVARFGGDEFCILLTDIDERAATNVAQKLQQAAHAASRVIPLTASLGVCAYRRGTFNTADALIHGADVALYYAKATGRSRVVSRSEVPTSQTLVVAPV
jgi:diguanylate cyclase (GGDEF)-like protein